MSFEIVRFPEDDPYGFVDSHMRNRPKYKQEKVKCDYCKGVGFVERTKWSGEIQKCGCVFCGGKGYYNTEGAECQTN